MPQRRSDPARPRPRVRVRIEPLGDSAVLAELGTRLDTALNTRAIALAAALKKRRDVRQAMAAHSSVTVQFNPEQVSHQAIAAAIRRLATRRPPVEEPGRLHRIPVVYDGADLEMVCSQLQISPARLVELVLPRRAVPRTQVPAGAVAIAGQQTGIYPLASPGGWHLIGRTSVRLFLPDSDPPSLFRVGDRVKFFAAQA